jgi:hypothetical protein
MTRQLRKKILALEMVLLLIVSGSVGYVIVSRQGLFTGRADDPNDSLIDETIKQTVETPQATKVYIKAGPIQGYGPLTVYFYGNPENDTNIVSYHWEFSSATTPLAPIIPQTEFNRINDQPYRKVIRTFILADILFTIASFATDMKTSKGPLSTFIFSLIFSFINPAYERFQKRIGVQYESTECNPVMVFFNVGSYSATLTVTDTQGNTSSDTAWITVLQYVYPDNNDD